jgi:hypothetical protein
MDSTGMRGVRRTLAQTEAACACSIRSVIHQCTPEHATERRGVRIGRNEVTAVEVLWLHVRHARPG